VRVATRLVDADAGTNDHHRAREPEHCDADANAISAQHAVAVAHREPHADECPRESDAARARPVLRC
jgi:hypothetical protein